MVAGFDHQLLAAGKQKQLPLVASMRKLPTSANTIVRTVQRWSAEYALATA